MITPQDILTLLNQLGIDPNDLVGEVFKKAGAQVGGRLAGASKAAVQHLAGRILRWRKAALLVDELAEAPLADRPTVFTKGFESWVDDETSDAEEASLLLYRLVYLLALKTHCRALPVVSGTDRPQDLLKVWVSQKFRKVPADRGTRENVAALQHFGDLPTAVAACSSPLVVSGATGAGKSTQLRKFVLDQADELLGGEDFHRLTSAPLPIYVMANSLLAANGDLATSLAATLTAELTFTLPFPIPDRFFDPRQSGSARKFYLVIDGFDEVPSAAQAKLAQKIKAISPVHAVIVGSRPNACWGDLDKIEPLELDNDQARQLVSNLSTTSAPRKIRGGLILRNPLLLTLATLLERENVTSHAALYREFVLGRLHDGQRNLVLGGDTAALLTFLEAWANDTTSSLVLMEKAASDLELLPPGLLGRERLIRVADVLVASGLVIRQGEHLAFIHDSFRHYFRAERLARSYRPSRSVWKSISLATEGSETVAFVVEIWIRERAAVEGALEALLSLGEPGLRLLSMLSARSRILPDRMATMAVEKWMYRTDDDFWDAGFIDGPIQQVALLAINHEAARSALRSVAGNSWTYSEDAAYAARGLAEAGFAGEAKLLLLRQAQDRDIYQPHRTLALDILIDLGATTDALALAKAIWNEWRSAPPDVEYAWLDLAEVFHRLGKRPTAMSILRAVSQKVIEELDLTFLAESYLKVGSKTLAARAARRAFKTMKWSEAVFRGHSSTASDLANLLERAGARREAEFVRQSSSRPSDEKTETLIQNALDTRRRAQDRLDSAEELLERGEKLVPVDVTDALLCDITTPYYERFVVIPRLMDIDEGRMQTIARLNEIASNEPWNRVAAAKALADLGAVADAVSNLRKVALDPAESITERVEAIEQLSYNGFLDLALAAARRLWNSVDFNVNSLRRFSELFAHTIAWPEFCELCERLLAHDSSSVKLQALIVLRKERRAGLNYYRAINLLRKVIRDKAAPIAERTGAASELEEFWDGDADEHVLAIALDPDEPVESGISAMQYLVRRQDEFMAFDGGHDVVWDEKLSVDEFIYAAHEFLTAMSGTQYEDDIVLRAIRDRLVSIASDLAEPIERRFAAAGISSEKGLFEQPFWLGVRAVADDERIPLQDRWRAIHYAVRHDPQLMDRYQPAIESGELEALSAAQIFLAAEWRDHAAKWFHAAFGEVRSATTRVAILKQLVALVEARFAGQAAGELLDEYLNEAEWDDGEVLADALLLSQGAQAEDVALQRARRIASDRRLNVYALSPVLNVIQAIGGRSSVDEVLTKRIEMELRSLSSTDGSIYSVLYLCRLQAEHGAGREAVQTLLALFGRPKMAFADRILICEVLARIGHTAIAHNRLIKLRVAAISPQQRLMVGDAAIVCHGWTVARDAFRELAFDSSADADIRIKAIGALVRIGAGTAARRALKKVDVGSVPLSEALLDTLVKCGQSQAATSLCTNHLANSQVDLLDSIEITQILAAVDQKDAARSILLKRLACDKDDISSQARGAEILHGMGFERDARTLLLQIDGKPVELSERLWLADAMLTCGLVQSSRRILAHMKSADLPPDSQDQLHSLWEMVEEAELIC